MKKNLLLCPIYPMESTILLIDKHVFTIQEQKNNGNKLKIQMVSILIIMIAL